MQTSNSAGGQGNKNFISFSKNIKYEAITEENETPMISPPSQSQNQVEVGNVRLSDGDSRHRHQESTEINVEHQYGAIKNHMNSVSI